MAEPFDVNDPDPDAAFRVTADDVIRAAPRRGQGEPVLRIADRFVTGTIALRAEEFPFLVEFVRCRIENPPDLRQASVAGLEFRQCHLPGLRARNLKSRSDLVLDGTVLQNGHIDLVDSAIDGSLSMRGCHLHNPGGLVMDATRISIGGAFLADELNASGTLVLRSARIADSLTMSGARVVHLPTDPHQVDDATGEPANAVDLSGADVRGSVQLSKSSVKGPVSLDGASVGMDVDLSHGDFVEESAAYTVNAENVTIARDLRCTGALVVGGILARRARIGRRATFDDVRIRAQDSIQDSALDAYEMQAQELDLTTGEPPRGQVSLRKVRCASLRDNSAFWETTGGVDLTEFRYDVLDPPIDPYDDKALRSRLVFIRTATRGYQPGPYDQLISVLRTAGTEQHASTVHIEKQRRHYETLARSSPMMGPLIRIASMFLRTFFGYGYRISRTVGCLFLVWVYGSLWFWFRTPPMQPDELSEWNPVAYSFDVLIPIIDLGYKDRWPMTGTSQWVVVNLTLLGWVLATTIAAEIARTLRRPPAMHPQ